MVTRNPLARFRLLCSEPRTSARADLPASEHVRQSNNRYTKSGSAIARITLALLIGVTLSAANAQVIIYVDDDAPLGGDGASWAAAYKYLQDALAAASDGDEIRVAGGTYTPDQDEAGNVTPGDREATFQLINGVAVRGGYRGCPEGDCGSGDPDERDFARTKPFSAATWPETMWRLPRLMRCWVSRLGPRTATTSSAAAG